MNLTKQTPKCETKPQDQMETNNQRVKEIKCGTKLGLESEQTLDFEDKDHFLKGVIAKCCIKEKVTRCFKM